MTDLTDTPSTDDATIAGSTGFVLSIDWEGRDSILRVLDTLVDFLVAVTLNGDASAFDAKVQRTDDGIVFVPWDVEADEPVKVADAVPFDLEVIDGLHVY